MTTTPRSRRFAALVLVGLLGFGFSARASAAPTEEERTAEVKLLRIINRAREAQGLKVLKEHATILEEARAQSARMAEVGELSHAGLDARKKRIAKADSGIAEDQICEAVASPPRGNVAKQMRKTARAWRGDEELSKCLLDGLGYEARSAAVGVVLDDNTFWVTFIAASDDSPGGA